MIGGTLKPEAIQLFCEYRKSWREVFLDEIDRFIWGANRTVQERAEIRKACLERGKALRAPSGGRRGRPLSANKEPPIEMTQSLPEHSDPGTANTEQGTVHESDQDWAQHGWFRTVCMCLGDIPANRSVFLREILLFILDADKGELAQIRKRVAEYARVKRPTRGRPDVRTNDNIMATALKVAWMRHVEHKKWQEIASTLPEYSHDDKFKTLRNLEDYAAATIWRVLPPNCTRLSALGREIAPGALDTKQVQTYIRFYTGLPFDTHAEECKRIVAALWERGADVDGKRLERSISRVPKPTV
jgi:hypothetical protein